MQTVYLIHYTISSILWGVDPLFGRGIKSTDDDLKRRDLQILGASISTVVINSCVP